MVDPIWCVEASWLDLKLEGLVVFASCGLNP